MPLSIGARHGTSDGSRYGTGHRHGHGAEHGAKHGGWALSSSLDLSFKSTADIRKSG